MSGAAKFLRSLIIGQPMSRREFLTGTAGTAAAAAAARAPVAAADVAAPAATARALSQADALPSAFLTGFDLPGGRYIIGTGGDAMVWGPSIRDYPVSKEEMDQIARVAAQAADSVGAMPGTGDPVYYNHLTQQWHAMGRLDTAPPGQRKNAYLKGGVIPPPDSQTLPPDFYAEKFGEAAGRSGTLSKAPPGAVEGSTQLDALRQQWVQSQKDLDALYRKMGSNAPPDVANRHKEVMRNLGYTAGGWHNVGPDPFPVNEMNITGMEPLPGSERPQPQSATTLRNIRRMLGIAAPVAAGAAAQDQKQGPVTSEVLR